jgi:cobalt-zinc-cadmium efflux system protein
MSEHTEHHHDHGDLKGKNLIITIVLNVIITVAQVIAGIISGSLALLSDALHNFSDVLALVIAKFANSLSAKDANYEKTFGYKRSKILAALFNSSVLVVIGTYLIYEAIVRFFNPQVVESNLVIYMAILSIVLNFASVVLLKDDSHDDVNIKSAYLHLLTDVMTSVAVLIGGLGMKYLGWFWIDPVITIIIAFYLIYMSYSLVFESIEILMQSTPKEIDLEKIKSEIEKFDHITNAHHMHVWKLDDKDIHLETHIDFDADLPLSVTSKMCEEISSLLREKFGITHTTIQSEFGNCETKELIIQQPKK